MYSHKAGYDVIVARDGDEAQRELRNGTFDLAILDIMMPGRTGCRSSGLCAAAAIYR